MPPDNHVSTLSFAAGGGGWFPHWLQRLLFCACAVNHVDIEMCAISTMLDLIVLTQSALVSQHQCHIDQLSTTGATRVLIKPLLTASDLTRLNTSTIFYQVVFEFLDIRVKYMLVGRMVLIRIDDLVENTLSTK
jgi:hypothetical protein